MNMNTAEMKEKMITDYIKNVDFISQNFSIDVMKKDLKMILQETPAIQVEYNKDRLMVEDKNTGVKKLEVNTNVKSITIAFSDGEIESVNTKGQTMFIPKIHKFTLYI